MANSKGHGGYRKPSNPAPVSGPGKYSQRTDGQVVSTMPGQPYGQAQADHAVESLAPMGAQKPLPQAAVAAPGGQAAPSAPQYQGGDFSGLQRVLTNLSPRGLPPARDRAWRRWAVRPPKARCPCRPAM